MSQAGASVLGQEFKSWSLLSPTHQRGLGQALGLSFPNYFCYPFYLVFPSAQAGWTVCSPNVSPTLACEVLPSLAQVPLMVSSLWEVRGGKKYQPDHDRELQIAEVRAPRWSLLA